MVTSKATKRNRILQLAKQRGALRNADFDPCAVTRTGAVRVVTAAVRALCIQTGQTAAQVGTIQDITAGQINTFEGTDLARLPGPEKADTTTLGFVYQPSFLPMLKSPAISVDYYNIKIKGNIGNFSPSGKGWRAGSAKRGRRRNFSGFN